ncbi:multidrug efflux SMR transporter [Bacillus sp. HMF5848]|uniref:DMT family transporter n=1 Tax=Bacillus sp. HMF5848 TaxID=2495421 RepID=UPI000F79A4E1|nr:multidrug efflux SMR transporter [Bacillus sp. HMF5848]RSK28485.1 multidrug efflux SMR transporter [Bacillus sp. HMF5848]
MTWAMLIIAGCFEVVGVIGIARINQKQSLLSYAIMIGGFGLSFLLLSEAMQEIDMGTAYAVWTGIGTVGSAVVGMLFYGESKNWIRLLCITLILVSVIGLKLIE